MKLKKEFYMRETLTVAKDLLGTTLVHETSEGILKGKIVEVEAYKGPKDAASHAYKNKATKRTHILFEAGGYAYIHLIYGMYYCFNVVTADKNVPESVLVRALEPLEGIDIMKKHRRTDNLKNLTNGPGKLCKALAINKDCYGLDLCTSSLYIEEGDTVPASSILATKRINIDYSGEAKEYLWRYVISDSKFLSVPVKFVEK